MANIDFFLDFKQLLLKDSDAKLIFLWLIVFWYAYEIDQVSYFYAQI